MPMKSWWFYAVSVAFVMSFPAPLTAQSIRCAVSRAPDGSYTGSCLQNGSSVGQLIMKSPAADEPHLWRGTATLDGAPGQDIGVDVRPDGTLRLGRSWLALKDVSTPTGSLMFTFGLNQPARATQVDGDILRQTRVYLAEVSHWNRHDLTNMDEAPTGGFNCPNVVARSLFCALYFASVATAGDYAHFRPAVEAVRQAIVSARGRGLYRHPLVDFNNDPRTTLPDVHAVLDMAVQLIRKQRAKDGV
jgi:hypothetical protein